MVFRTGFRVLWEVLVVFYIFEVDIDVVFRVGVIFWIYG